MTINRASGEDGMSAVVERNIKTLLDRQKLEDEKKSLQDRIADTITGFTGSMKFVYMHIVLTAGWILWNTGVFDVEAFDPSLVLLAMAASVEAIFLSTFVLISQNRMSRQAAKRAELNLQVTLLAEHEITQLAALVNSIAEKIGAKVPETINIDEISKDVDPKKVMDVLDDSEE